MSLAALRRLASMPAVEVRFRVACELHKLKGRCEVALRTPRWDRRTLATRLAAVESAPAWEAARAALARSDARGAHAALAQYFSSRSGAFPLEARQVPSVSQAVTAAFPDAPAEARLRGDAILRGEYDLLGYRELHVGTEPDWHLDVVSGRRAPRMFWADVPFLDPSTGDHKVTWELNRHQHWLALGRAFALSGDRRYYTAFVRQLASWLDANPPLVGTNWASMLELAFRVLSWLWALELFAGSASEDDEAPWLVDLLLALDRQLTHVEENLSYYFSPNTHLSGEALALYVGGLALPGLSASPRRVALGRNVLLTEAARQIGADGGHVELSAHYHRYSTDFYLLAFLVARRAGDSAAAGFEAAARRQARYLRTLADEAGIRPQLGDDDGGQLFPMCGRPAADCRDTLATASILLDEPALRIGAVPEEAYWMCGPEAAAVPEVPRAHWPSAALPASGYFVSRTESGDQLILDAGPHGFLNGGHAHADALSVVLTAGGRPVLVDPGTASYTVDAELRDRFRSTSMHNTVVLDGRPQSIPRGPFHWTTRATARSPISRTGTGCDYAEATHAAYAPARHTRVVLAAHGLGWWIVDHLLGEGECAAEAFWHVHPAWSCRLDTACTAALESGTSTLVLASTAPLRVLPPGSTPLAHRSPEYGRIEPAPVLVGAAAGALPDALGTFVTAAGLGGPVSIARVTLTTPPAPPWHGVAFRMTWPGGSMVLLSAVDRHAGPDSDAAAPPERWGTEDVHTDGRAALLIHAAQPEAIVVNGSRVQSGEGDATCGARAPLARLPFTFLASRVHEVRPVTVPAITAPVA